MNRISSLGFLPLWLVVGCAGADPGGAEENVAAVEQAVTGDPVAICNQDPRVNLGLVPLAVCAGARVFFNETFGGNGRTCGTCHPAANNYTIDANFIAGLPLTDPLFVDKNPAFSLGALEMPELRGPFATIKENVDDFLDLDHKFVGRAVSHTLSLATTITGDPTDGTGATQTQRTGWSGDGAPGDGSLRSFVDGAIKQHFPKDLGRTIPASFRAATNTERDQLLAFQLALGRTNELNLNTVTLADAGAAAGKAAFMDPLVGRCNECHSNAGANSRLTGKNANFNTGSIFNPSSASTLADGRTLFDGGFGGQGRTEPNLSLPLFNGVGFGDGSFNVPPLIEAADTAPFFHSHSIGNQGDTTKGIEQAVSFYNSDNFLQSPAADLLNKRFNAPINVAGSFETIGRFLRVLNASFNLAIAKQRLDSARALNIAYWSYRDDIQKGLMNLASEEIEDAIRVLDHAFDPGFINPTPLHAAQQASLQTARDLLTQGVNASDPAIRKARTESAITLVQNAKSAFGTNMNFTLGAGNLMY